MNNKRYKVSKISVKEFNRPAGYCYRVYDTKWREHAQAGVPAEVFRYPNRVDNWFKNREDAQALCDRMNDAG